MAGERISAGLFVRSAHEGRSENSIATLRAPRSARLAAVDPPDTD
jgi:hypothetical protein